MMDMVHLYNEIWSGRLREDSSEVASVQGP